MQFRFEGAQVPKNKCLHFCQQWLFVLSWIIAKSCSWSLFVTTHDTKSFVFVTNVLLYVMLTSLWYFISESLTRISSLERTTS